MSSFGEDDRIIDAVHNVSDYTRQVVTHEELKDISHFQPLLNWWTQVNEEKQHLPSRKDFNPATFKAILPNITIVEPVYKDEELVDFTTTLIGTELAKVYGEVTGKSISTHDNEYVVQAMLNTGKECLLRRKPVGIISKAASAELPFNRSYALYCPLATDQTNVDKLLIHVSFENCA